MRSNSIYPAFGSRFYVHIYPGAEGELRNTVLEAIKKAKGKLEEEIRNSTDPDTFRPIATKQIGGLLGPDLGKVRPRLIGDSTEGKLYLINTNDVKIDLAHDGSNSEVIHTCNDVREVLDVALGVGLASPRKNNPFAFDLAIFPRIAPPYTSRRARAKDAQAKPVVLDGPEKDGQRHINHQNVAKLFGVKYNPQP